MVQEKPGIEHATPGLQSIVPIHYSFAMNAWRKKSVISICLWPCSLAIISTGRDGFMVLWFYVQEHLKAQPAVVLILKHLRRQGYSLKSHPTDWEKLGIELATPGLQDIGFSHTHRRLLLSAFVLYMKLISGEN